MQYTQSFYNLFHISHEVFDSKMLFKKKFFHNKMGTKLLKTANMLFQGP